jgi:hypothetical protein
MGRERVLLDPQHHDPVHGSRLQEGVMRITASYILHPWRGPEWGELLCAMLAGLQFVYAVAQFDDLQREALELTVFFSPVAWTAAGLVMAVGHIVALRFAARPGGRTMRIAATGLSMAFWFHLVLTVGVQSVMADLTVPVLLLPSVAAPLLSGAVLYRLCKQY